jgi:hypothetical protein
VIPKFDLVCSFHHFPHFHVLKGEPGDVLVPYSQPGNPY